MGFLATVAEFLRSKTGEAPTPEVKCNLGGDDAVTGYHFAPPGVDAQPLAGDLVYLGEDLGRGNAQALAYQDPKNEGTAGPGEWRAYSRDENGAVTAEIWIMADGSILLQNVVKASSVELTADGAFKVDNGTVVVELGADGKISITNGQATAELGSDGAIELSNATGGIAVDASGNVTATTPLGSFGAGTHTHTTPFGPSGPPMPGT